MPSQIVAIHSSQIDPDTEAPISHWIVAQWTVRFEAEPPTTQVVLKGYTSASAHRNKKRALAHVPIELPGLPDAEPVQWLYAAVLKKKDSPLADAAPVIEEVAATAAAPEVAEASTTA